MAANPSAAADQRLDPEVAIGIVGAGAMGAGIAQVVAVAGHPVCLFDARPGVAQSAVDGVLVTLTKLADKQKVTPAQVTKAQEGLKAVSTLEALSCCGLIIEAIIEDLDAKRALFQKLEEIVAENALLASNTSSISITAIGSAIRQPQRLAGLHFFNPAPVMPLVEVVGGAATSESVLKMLYETTLGWGKVPVRARSTPGFIVNRVARPFYAESLRVLSERAADCATIDAVIRESGGFRMGAFELMDLIGHDVNYAVTRSVFNAFYGDPRFTPSLLQLELVEAGFLGRKSGRGFYKYQDGKALSALTNAAAAPRPTNIRIYGESSEAQTLSARWTQADLKFEVESAHSDGRIAQCRQCILYRTDGRTATARAATTGIHNTIVSDLALDGNASTRRAIAAADQADGTALIAAVGLLQSAGYTVSVIDDVPGMIVMRTVAMLANEAADAVNQGVCSVSDVNLAMRKGVNYPKGPLEWADEVGPDVLLEVLDNLASVYGEDRYRASPLLRRKTLASDTFSVGKGHNHG